MVVNLFIAVICDAVHVMKDENKAGFGGLSMGNENISMSYYLSECPSGAMKEDSNYYQAPGHLHGSELHRLKQLQLQLNEMVIVQEQMRTKMELLAKLLQDKQLRDCPLPPDVTKTLSY